MGRSNGCLTASGARKWRWAWAGLLLLALSIGISTIVFRGFLSDELFLFLVVFANAAVVTAIVIDSTKLRHPNSKSDRSHRSKMSGKTSKKYEVGDSDRAAAVDEESMTLWERLVYRANKSAESANIKNSGL